MRAAWRRRAEMIRDAAEGHSAEDLKARGEACMAVRLSPVACVAAEAIATASVSVTTDGPGFTEITGEASHFLSQAQAGDGVLLLFVRHTSASLVIQENAAAEVRTDLAAALSRLAPRDAGWMHDTEGPDDMPAHVKAMLTGVSLHVPVAVGRLALGTWQGIYLIEHRERPHRREVWLQFIGSRRR